MRSFSLRRCFIWRISSFTFFWCSFFVINFSFNVSFSKRNSSALSKASRWCLSNLAVEDLVLYGEVTMVVKDCWREGWLTWRVVTIACVEALTFPRVLFFRVDQYWHKPSLPSYNRLHVERQKPHTIFSLVWVCRSLNARVVCLTSDCYHTCEQFPL